MKSKILNAFNKASKKLQDEIPKYPENEKLYSFNKELILREITSFKWLLSICISFYIAMIISLSPLFKVNQFEKEVASISGNIIDIGKNLVCSFPEKFSKFHLNLGYYQFVDPFSIAINKYFKKQSISYELKIQPIKKNLFSNYPNIKSCKQSYNLKYGSLDSEELRVIDAKDIFEKHTWLVSFPNEISVNYDNTIQNKAKLKTSKGVELCSIDFDNQNTWIAKIATNDCKEKTFDITGNVTWRPKEIGPIMKSFIAHYPLLNNYWYEISQLKVNNKSKIISKLYDTFSVYIPFFKIELKLNKHHVLTYYIIQLFLLLIILIKASNLNLKSQKLNIKFTIYYSKLTRYLSLTFLYCLLIFLNAEMIQFIYDAYNISVISAIYLIFIPMIIVILYLYFIKKLVNEKYIGMLALIFAIFLFYAQLYF